MFHASNEMKSKVHEIEDLKIKNKKIQALLNISL